MLSLKTKAKKYMAAIVLKKSTIKVVILTLQFPGNTNNTIRCCAQYGPDS